MEDLWYSEGARRPLRAFPVVRMERLGWAMVTVLVLPGHGNRGPEARRCPRNPS